MPHHPTEEEAPSGITEMIAKDPSSQTESTASDHPLHHNEHTPSSAKATVQDLSGKGPQMSSDLPSVEGTKDELKAKAAEMNK